MARVSSRMTGSSKIRFIMLEADLADGDVAEISQAITNALRQGQPVPKGALLASTTPHVEGAVDSQAGPIEFTQEVETLRTPRPKAPRKFRSPKVLSDVELNSGEMAFERFAKGKKPGSDLKRFLVSAYWFKRYRNTAVVSSDHVYTCYKKMGWGANILDFAQPLRDLARSGSGEMKDGLFAINHIGEDSIEKMASE